MSKKPQVVETVTQIKTLIRDNYFNLNCCKGVGSLDNSNVGLHLSVDLINKMSQKRGEKHFIQRFIYSILVIGRTVELVGVRNGKSK